MPRAPKEKDQIDKLIDQLDLSEITQDEMFGEGGLLQTLTTRLLNKALEAEMDHHLGYKKNSAAGEQYREQQERTYYKEGADQRPGSGNRSPEGSQR